MKIKVYHDVCGREILVRQILQTGGHCPWDGLAFSKDYTAVLAEALETTESAGSTLENALEKMAGTNPTFTIDRQSLLGPLGTHLDDLNSRPRGGRR